MKNLSTILLFTEGVVKALFYKEQKYFLRFFFFCFCCLMAFSSLFGREKLVLYTHQIAQQPIENRLNFVFALEYTWQKDTANFAKIDSIETIAGQLGDKALAQYAQLFRHEYKIYFAKDTTEKAQYLKIAKAFAQKSKLCELYAHLLYAVGIYDFYMRRVKESLPLVLEAKKILDKLNYRDFSHASYYHKGLFDFYLYFEDFHAAITYAEAALANKHDLIYFPADYYNNIAICYQRMKDYDTALPYYLKAITDAESRKDTNFMALVEGNIGAIYFLKKEFTQALPYFYKDFYTNETKIPENAIITRYLIANCLLRLDSVEKAKTFLLDKKVNIPIWEHPIFPVEKYRVMSLYYQKTGNYKLATQYKDSLIMLKDSLRILYDVNKLKNFETLMQAENTLTEHTEIEAEAQKQRLIRNMIIMALVVLLALSVLWLSYRHRKKSQIQQQKQQHTDEMLVRAKQELTNYLANIKDKNDLIERIRQELAAANVVQSLPETVKNTYLENLQNSVILTEAHWTDFKNLFEQVFPQFFPHINATYPDLTPAEIRLLALEKLDLRDKEAGGMLGISADSVKKARYRLRKKYPELWHPS